MACLFSEPPGNRQLAAGPLEHLTGSALTDFENKVRNVIYFEAAHAQRHL
jgi:hypothetical protein